jgi:predicted nuclease with TOPRIM domain
MEAVAFCRKIQMEWKAAKRRLESAIRIFGPDNVTSITDKETFGYKLASITRKLEIFIEKSQEVIDELEKLRDKDAETETEFVTGIDEINSFTEVIINKVNDNESKVKKKMEEVIKEFENNRNVMISSKTEFPLVQSSCSKLSVKIAEYCEIGPFLTHRPQFLSAAKYIIGQYQEKLPTVG